MYEDLSYKHMTALPPAQKQSKTQEKVLRAEKAAADQVEEGRSYFVDLASVHKKAWQESSTSKHLLSTAYMPDIFVPIKHLDLTRGENSQI